MDRVCPEKRSLTGPQLVKKFSPFYGTHKFIIPFTSARLFPILSQINPIHVHIYFLKISFNIILPSTPRASKWSLSPMTPNQNSVHSSPSLNTCYMPRPCNSF